MAGPGSVPSKSGLHRQNSIHIHTTNPVASDAVIQQCEPAHTARHSIASVGINIPRAKIQAEADPDMKLEEIATPEPVLRATACEQQGMYKVTVGDESRIKLQRWESYGKIVVATQEELEAIMRTHPLPEINVQRPNLRMLLPRKTMGEEDIEKVTVEINDKGIAKVEEKPVFGSVGSNLWVKSKLVELGFYKSTAVLILLANLGLLLGMLIARGGNLAYATAATIASANLTLGILMRHEHFINAVFRIVIAIPKSAPLWLRVFAGRLSFNNGGVHVGAGTSAFGWFVCYTVLLLKQFVGTDAQHAAVNSLVTAILIDFIMIIGLAHPTVRSRYHDIWEMSHRFGGWAAVALVWSQFVVVASVLAQQQSIPTIRVLVVTPSFWFLLFISWCLVYPWLHLRRHPVNAQQLSAHATRLWFGGKTPAVCVGTRLAHAPLLENHGFATIANTGPVQGFSVIISNAGDFTKKMIADPPKHIWTRGAKTIGVVRLAELFRPIVVVATGSGIGPCLSFFQPRIGYPMHIIWSARSPEVTYGCSIVDSVRRADNKALIIDTKKTGHPNLVALAWSAVQETRAEMVIVVSNSTVTRMVMNELQTRNVPVFGPVFDS